MLPNNEKCLPCTIKSQPVLPGEEIVISGISGKFPNAENIQIFADKLYSKTDMVDDEELRWKHFNNDIPRRMGKIAGLQNFDATFFGVHYKQAQTMDPQGRLLIETAFEAVIDAGINPKLLRETKTGCYIGACFSESEKTWFYEKISSGGFGITGCSRAMLANRISYCLGINGPSFLIDTACSSSMYALDCAFAAIKNGECEAALVGGSNLIIHPYVTLQFAKLGVLAADGFCRPFDANASGYTRSEAISVILLQKAKAAKRIYATIEYSKTNCDGYKLEGITYPSSYMQEKLLTEFYEDIGLDPSTINYVEAHSTGTAVGDPEECNAIDNVFCKNRKSPLLVGSVKSNIGHSESTSGICSIAKVILAFETGTVAPNLHFNQPKTTIKALMEGRLSVCTETTDLKGNLVAINSFGFGGANAHILLRQHKKRKINFGMPMDNIPRIVNWSSRTEKGVSEFFDAIASERLDAELLGLIQSTQSNDIAGYLYRGYSLLENNPTGNAKCLNREIQHFSGLRRPIVWVFTGMGSQWTEMGSSLMELPVFRSTVERLQLTMQGYGIDLIKIITTDDPKAFDNILHSFVGIAVIQAALVDVLRSINVPYDFLIGHSLGELGCAYADGTITAEQMILAAYFRGVASVETKIIRGAMAAIGLGYKQIKNEVPPTIDIACHNGPDSCTISGPEEDVRTFVETLKKDGIFAKEVASSHIAYHSRYIKELGPKLLKMLREHIPNPKRRSEKWLSTSIPMNRWDQEDGKFSSAEYHTNNLLNSVLFEESMALLPANALTIEIAPHALLHSILKKSMPNATHIALTQRGNKNNLQFFLNALGQMYLNGLNMQLEKLYPEVKFPVSRGTRMLSPLVRWEHSEEWFVPRFELQRTSTSWERKVKVSLKDQDYDTIDGHIIDGRCLIPATAYIQLIWETMAIINGPVFFDFDVEFEDIRFLRATSMAKGEEIDLIITILRGTGQFSVTDGSTAVVTGVITEIHKTLPLTTVSTTSDSDYPMLQSEDFYKELRLRGYHYEGAFKGVKEVRGDGLYAKVKWENNWISFLDSLLQVQILLKDSRSLALPTRIQKLRINSRDHMKMASRLDVENSFFEVHLCKTLGILVCGGVEMSGIHTSTVNRRKFPGNLVLENYKFISHFPSPMLCKSDAVRACVQLALENNPMLKIKAVEVDTSCQTPIIDEFQNALDVLPLITADLMLLTPQDIDLGKIHVENGQLKTQTNCYFVIVRNGLSNLKEIVEISLPSLRDDGYLVSRETQSLDLILNTPSPIPNGLQRLAVFRCDEETLVMYRKIKKRIQEIPKVLFVNSNDFTWLDELRASIKEVPVILVAQNDKLSGVMGLVNCIRKESLENSLSCVFIDDVTAPPFDMQHPFYSNQMNLGLAMNVYRNGNWGSYRHLELQQTLDEKPRNDHCYANVLQRGDLSSLRWIQGPIDVTNTENLVTVQYASLNFRDVMLATGRLSFDVVGSSRLDQECVLGLEYAGVDRNGERKMGLVISGSLATHITPRRYLSWKVPDHWSLKEAVTCPVVYMTVYAALFLFNPIKKGKSILIHAGSGGVGLAAIRVAFAYGLEVYTTVSNEIKKKFVMETFPRLKESNIGNSRDCSFETMIKMQTNGKGVDYVLNSLADDKLHASIRCLGSGGTFLEIGKFDMANNTKIGLGDFLKEIAFRSVLVDNLFATSHDSILLSLSRLVENDIRSGVIQPLHATVFDVSEVEKAFRYLGTGKHVGKVVLKIRDDPISPFCDPIKVFPRQYCDPNLVYVIPGGLGGFGMELADWMVMRGARKLVLSSSRGISNSYQRYRIKLFEGYGAEVMVNTSNISTIKGCEELLRTALSLGPIGGIFNLAVVLRDNILDNQDAQKFTECLAPKAVATVYLDQLSRKLCPKLQYFVVFSSISCGRGNAGQSNYGMANSVMERIIEQRLACGLPGKAIQWGAVGEVGILADIAGNKLDVEIMGTVQQRIASCLSNLDILLASSEAVVGSMVVAEKRFSSGKLNVMDSVLNIMGIRDLKQISMTASLSEVGMDSLMAVELKQTLEREFEIFLTPEDLRCLTFARLQELADAQNKDGSENVKLKLAGEKKTFGLNLILRNLGDEKNCKEPYVRLQTKNFAEKFNSCMLIVPGIEGVAGVAWHNVGRNINLPAFVLQLASTVDMKTIPEIAHGVANNVQEIFNKKEFFYLVGYSFGALITLELARILEASGMNGNVVLIDGAPVYLQQLSYAHYSSFGSEISDEYIQLMLIVAIIQNIFPLENTDELMMKLKECPTWEAKVDKLIQFGKSQTEYTEEYMRLIAHAMYNRLKIVFASDITKVEKIKSPITLIRPTEVAFVEIEEDYELSRYTEGPVTLKFIEGNHTTMLDNIKLADIINECDPYSQSNKNFKSYVWHGKAEKLEF